MLQSIRDRATGWIAWIIIGFISIPFALWGINEYFTPEPYVYVAEVNGVKITQRELTQGVQNQRERLRRMFGKNYRPDMISDAVLKKQVLDDLIEAELLAQAAVAAGLRVGDEQLARRIRQTEIFQEGDGRFSRSRYERLVKGAGMTTKTYEARERRSILMQQLHAGLSGSALVTTPEVDRLIRLREQTRDVAFVRVPASRYQDQVEVSDEEIERYYQENKRRFMSDERVKLDYIELRLDDLARGIVVDETELRNAYEEQLARFAEDEQRKASHILITVDGNDPAAEEAARKKAEELREQLRNGADFAELARQYSEDPGSAQQGGDLGFFGRGVMDKAFEDRVFSLGKGEISEPVRSAFGYHLIRLDDIKGGDVKPFAEVRGELERELQRQQAEAQFYDQSERLANLSYEYPDTLETAAEQLGLELKKSGWVTRDQGKGVFAKPAVREAAFSEDVLNGGHNSELIELSPEHYVVLRVRNHEVSVQRPLEEVREEIRGILRSDKARQRARSEAEGLVQEARQGKTLAELVEAHGLEHEAPGWVKRDARDVPASIRNRAFTLPHPRADTPVYDLVELGRGDYAVLALKGVRQGDPSGMEKEKRERFENSLRLARGQAEYEAVLAGFRERSEVRIFEQNL